MRKCPKPLINTFAWAIWLTSRTTSRLLYYKGSVLSIGFVSFFNFSLLPRFCFQQKLLINYPTGNYRNGWFSSWLSIKNSIPISVVSPVPEQLGLPFRGCRLPELSLLSGGYCPFPTWSEFRRWFVPCCRNPVPVTRMVTISPSRHTSIPVTVRIVVLPALLHRRKKQNHAVRSGMRLLLHLIYIQFVVVEIGV